MQHWWVNQNQTYKYEVVGCYLWSPKVSADGRRNRCYESMTETKPGDVVFSFCDTYIKAIGIVSCPYESAPKPTEFGKAGDYWSHEGWFVPVQFVELDKPIRSKDYMGLLASTLPDKYSPLQANGNGNQGVYLTPVPENMAAVLRQLLENQVEAIENASVVEYDTDAIHALNQVMLDTGITETERVQLINARVGQGLFRSRVEMIDSVCRITGVGDRRFLRASHIKPWSKSENFERLDGNNGLMMSPHVDHLFDKGFISFTDNGLLLLSPQLPPTILLAWKLEHHVQLRPFNPAQAAYLAYHRQYVFKGSVSGVK